MKESALMRSIQVALSKDPDIRLFRNNVGVLQDINGQHVRYGLCQGSSDLIGWTTITVTPSMVGKRIAVFTAQEVKTDAGRPSKEQTAFIDAVRRAGGKAGIVRGIEDAETLCYSTGD